MGKDLFGMNFDDLIKQADDSSKEIDKEKTEKKTNETESKSESKPKKKMTNAFSDDEAVEKKTENYKVDSDEVFGKLDNEKPDEFSKLETDDAIVKDEKSPARGKVFGQSESKANKPEKPKAKTFTPKSDKPKAKTFTPKSDKPKIKEKPEENKKRQAEIINDVKPVSVNKKSKVTIEADIDPKILDLIDQKDLEKLIKSETDSLNSRIKNLAKESFKKLLN